LGLAAWLFRKELRQAFEDFDRGDKMTILDKWFNHSAWEKQQRVKK